MDTVHLVYRDSFTGRITRYEAYTPPESYGWRGYALDILAGVALTLSLGAVAMAAGVAVLLIGG